jgi:hypothetical protein
VYVYIHAHIVVTLPRPYIDAAHITLKWEEKKEGSEEASKTVRKDERTEGREE